MSKDIQVFTAIDAKVKPAESLDILLLSTEGAAPMKTYTDLEKINADFEGKKVAAMATKLFNQDNTLADTLIRKVRIVGIENPQNVGGKASTIKAAFDGLSTSEELTANTDYYAKIGGKAVVKITTGDTAPADEAAFAALFDGVTFTEDGVEFRAEAAEKTVVFTSTTRTAISGYTADIGLYKDEDCFESLELGGCDVVITIGTGDVTKEENLVKALEEIRDADDDFYFVLTDVTDEDCVTALCKWAEGTEPTEAALGAGVEDHRKFYFGQVTNKEYVNNYGRSAVVYTDDPSEWADAAWVGSVGPFWPESVT